MDKAQKASNSEYVLNLNNTILSGYTVEGTPK
jgi:hypothetical protein